MEFDFCQVIAVAVIYEIDLNCSTTVISLNESAARMNTILDVFVYDNSKIDRSTPFLNSFSNLNIAVYHDPQNSGVSKAYNYSVRQYREKKEWYLLFDQDTKLPVNALDSYYKACNLACKNNISLVVPVVVDSIGKIWSPSREVLSKGKHFRREKLKYGRVEAGNLLYINSGAMINGDVFDKIGLYDEDLFYFSDHEFFKRYQRNYSNSYVMNLEFLHDISSHGRDSIEDATKRLPILLRDSKKYSSLQGTPLPFLWICLQTIKLAIIYRNLKLVTLLFKKY